MSGTVVVGAIVVATVGAVSSGLTFGWSETKGCCDTCGTVVVVADGTGSKINVGADALTPVSRLGKATRTARASTTLAAMMPPPN